MTPHLELSGSECKTPETLRLLHSSVWCDDFYSYSYGTKIVRTTDLTLQSYAQKFIKPNYYVNI